MGEIEPGAPRAPQGFMGRQRLRVDKRPVVDSGLVRTPGQQQQADRMAAAKRSTLPPPPAAAPPVVVSEVPDGEYDPEAEWVASVRAGTTQPDLPVVDAVGNDVGVIPGAGKSGPPTVAELRTMEDALARAALPGQVQIPDVADPVTRQMGVGWAVRGSDEAEAPPEQASAWMRARNPARELAHWLYVHEDNEVDEECIAGLIRLRAAVNERLDEVLHQDESPARYLLDLDLPAVTFERTEGGPRTLEEWARAVLKDEGWEAEGLKFEGAKLDSVDEPPNRDQQIIDQIGAALLGATRPLKFEGPDGPRAQAYAQRLRELGVTEISPEMLADASADLFRPSPAIGRRQRVAVLLAVIVVVASILELGRWLL